MRDKIKKLFLIPLFISYSIFAQEKEDSIPTKAESKSDKEETVNIENSNSSELQSQADKSNLTQAQIRESRKLETGLGVCQSLGSKCNELKVQFNLTPRFSLGVSYHHDKYSSGSFFLQPTDDSNIPYNVRLSYFQNSHMQDLGLINFRYYLFEKIPLYITGGIGKDFSSDQRTDYSLTRINSLAIAQIRTMDITPSYSYFGGIGFQWVFKIGIIVGIETIGLKSINQKRNQYTISIASAPSEAYMDFIIYSFLSDRFYTGEKKSNPQVYSCWIGYSLSI